MSDPVLRIQTNGARWLVQLWNARALVAPLTDADLANIAGLPVFASTWEQLLAHLAPNGTWTPERRILAALGTLIRERIVSGKVAARLNQYVVDARHAGRPVRYVVHLYGGEEDGLLRRLPYELMYEDSFWFRRTFDVGVRGAIEGTEADVDLHSGSRVLIASAPLAGRSPTPDELVAHTAAIAALARRAGFVPRVVDNCTSDALRSELAAGCDLLYLVCHGEEDLDCYGRVMLADRSVTGDELGQWIEALRDRTRLRVQAALICACSTAEPGRHAGSMGMAQHLSDGDRRAVAALGFRDKVSVSWALAFMTKVFDELAGCGSLELAVTRARAAQDVTDAQWALPLYYAHERVQRPQRGTESLHAPVPPPAFPSKLPAAQRAYFTAREAELKQLRAWYAKPGAAIVAALGEGGVGKTEIARAFVHEIAAAGVPVIWLDRPDADVEGALSNILRVRDPDFRPAPTATRAELVTTVRAILGQISGLLVLDDLVISSAIAELNPGHWKVLVTTRDRDAIPSAETIDLQPLSTADSLTLLARVAFDQDSLPPQDVVEASRLVERVSCLPLAIEVLAEHLRRGSTVLDEIAALDSTANGPVIEIVGSIIGRSLADLDPDDERAWALAAALPLVGATAGDIAVGLAEPVGRSARRLRRLSQLHLVRLNVANDRYTLHSLARVVARARAAKSGVLPSVCANAALVIAARSSECLALLESDFEEGWQSWRMLRTFFDEIEFGLWPVGAQGADSIAAALVDVEEFRKLDRTIAERVAYLQTAVVRAQLPLTRARAHFARADLFRFRSDLGNASAEYELALKFYREADDDFGQANTLFSRGNWHLLRGELHLANEDLTQALRFFDRKQNLLGSANVLGTRGELLLMKGDLRGALEDFNRAVTGSVVVNDRLGIANALSGRAKVLIGIGEFAYAERDLANAEQLYLERGDEGDQAGVATVQRARGSLFLSMGRLDDAENQYKQALMRYRRAEHIRGESAILCEMANLSMARHDKANAARYCDEAEGLARRSDEPFVLERIQYIRRWLRS